MSSGTYPGGSDTITVKAEGESIVAYCYVCDPVQIIGMWDKSVSLNFIIGKLFKHQEEIARTYPTSKENDV